MKHFSNKAEADWGLIIVICAVVGLIVVACTIVNHKPEEFKCPKCGAIWNEDTAVDVHTFAHDTYYCPDCNANGTLVIIGSD